MPVLLSSSRKSNCSHQTPSFQQTADNPPAVIINGRHTHTAKKSDGVIRGDMGGDGIRRSSRCRGKSRASGSPCVASRRSRNCVLVIPQVSKIWEMFRTIHTSTSVEDYEWETYTYSQEVRWCYPLFQKAL